MAAPATIDPGEAAASPPAAEEVPPIRALDVLRRGLAESAELRTGVALTVAMAMAGAVGKLVLPIVIQQVLDRGIQGPEGFRPGLVYGATAATALVIVVFAAISRATYVRLVRNAEAALRSLRVRVFAHIHRLSIADHTETRKGVLVARVTTDIEQVATFLQWGAVSWIVNGTLVLGTLAVMLVYAWQLALVTLLVYLPILPVLRGIQRRQLQAYDRVRTRVGDTVSLVSETITGAPVLRAYRYRDPMRTRLDSAIGRQYRAQLAAHKWFAFLLPISDLFGALAMAAVIGVGVGFGDDWGLSSGDLIAFLFLVNLLLMPVNELGEVLDQTQTALAGWSKVLTLLDQPIEITEPDPGRTLPVGALEVEVEALRFAYRDGPEVLHGVDLVIPAGAQVAVVGETGSGKTTFAKLLCRLADPTGGQILIDGVDLREVSGASRRASIRMVPQDGFLFDTSIRENVRYGRPGAVDADVDAAFSALGLHWWLERLPLGLDTPVGERGDSLSVGERQLVALARAELADPGLLILDEATSAVDPETEQALAAALVRLAEGRTTISVAHRLSTAERADLVLVFDRGRLVEQGSHAELVAAGGVYAGLHAAWLGSTRATTR